MGTLQCREESVKESGNQGKKKLFINGDLFRAAGKNKGKTKKVG